MGCENCRAELPPTPSLTRWDVHLHRAHARSPLRPTKQACENGVEDDSWTQSTDGQALVLQNAQGPSAASAAKSLGAQAVHECRHKRPTPKLWPKHAKSLGAPKAFRIQGKEMPRLFHVFVAQQPCAAQRVLPAITPCVLKCAHGSTLLRQPRDSLLALFPSWGALFRNMLEPTCVSLIEQW